MQNQLACAKMMNNPSEYRKWLKIYVRRLTDDQSEHKLTELFNELYGYISIYFLAIILIQLEISRL
jgi:hypothetical protein